MAAGSVEVRASFTPKDARLTACPLASLEDVAGPLGECTRDVNQGVRTPLAGGIHLFRLESDRPISLDLLMGYIGGGEVEVRYPRTLPATSAAACADHACDAFFERLPVASGRLLTSASFEGGIGTLLVEQGRVLGRSLTATGVPYRIAGQRTGGPPLAVEASVTSNDEYAVSLQQSPGPGANGLRDIRLRMTWPS